MHQTQKLQLRRKAHHLQPVIILGQQGLTPQVHTAIEEALVAHELIKIRVNAEDKAKRQRFIQEILTQHHVECIQSIGHLVVVYRKSEKSER